MYSFTSASASSDRFAFNSKDEHRIEKLARKLDYPIDEIFMAVREVGFDIDEVEEYIRDRQNRG